MISVGYTVLFSLSFLTHLYWKFLDESKFFLRGVPCCYQFLLHFQLVMVPTKQVVWILAPHPMGPACDEEMCCVQSLLTFSGPRFCFLASVWPSVSNSRWPEISSHPHHHQIYSSVFFLTLHFHAALQAELCI
jgi:hypothetical protein